MRRLWRTAPLCTAGRPVSRGARRAALSSSDQASPGTRDGPVPSKVSEPSPSSRRSPARSSCTICVECPTDHRSAAHPSAAATGTGSIIARPTLLAWPSLAPGPASPRTRAPAPSSLWPWSSSSAFLPSSPWEPSPAGARPRSPSPRSTRACRTSASSGTWTSRSRPASWTAPARSSWPASGTSAARSSISRRSRRWSWTSPRPRRTTPSGTTRASTWRPR